MSKLLDPTEPLLLVAPCSGWTSERAALSGAELATLMELVKPGLDGRGREKFEMFVQNIFSFAVVNVREQNARGGFSVARLRRKVKNFVGAIERAQSIVDRLDPDVRALIDHELAEVAYRQEMSRQGPRASIEQWRAAASDLLGPIVSLNRRLEAATVKGERSTIYRQMVRGLVALVYDVTGKLPKRKTFRRPELNKSLSDDYWFLSLSQQLANFVYARAELAAGKQQMKPPIAPPMSKRNRKGPPAEPETETAVPATGGRSGRTRKIAGPGSLAMVVRQELDSFEKELAGKEALDRDGGE